MVVLYQVKKMIQTNFEQTEKFNTYNHHHHLSTYTFIVLWSKWIDEIFRLVKVD